LVPVLKHDETNSQVEDRLIYVQMRAGRFTDSLQAIAAYQKRGKLDAYGDALAAIQKMTDGDVEGSDAAMRDAVLDDPTNLGVRSAEAYIALRRGKFNVLAKLADDLAQDASERPEVNYYLAAVYNALGRIDEGTARFERAVLAEPMCYDVYVQRGNDALSLAIKGKLEKKDVEFQYEVAKVFYNTALAAKPECAEALTGLSLVSQLQKKTTESVVFARAATGAGPGYAAGFYAYSSALEAQEEDIRTGAMKAEKEGRHDDAMKLYDQADQINKQATEALDKAGKLDQAFLANLALIPRLNEAYAYFVRHGKLPLLTPPNSQ
jgi:tetratricopeptide (TPR) repeat protein